MKKLYDLSAMTPVEVPIDELDPAAFQPKARTKKTAMKDLRRSIVEELETLVYPIVVTVEGGIIDGHRRYAVLRDTGHKYAPCLVLEEDQALMFAALNSTQRRMQGKDLQEIYLKDPTALTKNQREKQRTAEIYFGEETYRRIVNEGLAVCTSFRPNCRKTEDLFSKNGYRYSRSDIVDATLTVGQRKVHEIHISRKLTEEGKADELAALLFRV